MCENGEEIKKYQLVAMEQSYSVGNTVNNTLKLRIASDGCEIYGGD